MIIKRRIEVSKSGIVWNERSLHPEVANGYVLRTPIVKEGNVFYECSELARPRRESVRTFEVASSENIQRVSSSYHRPFSLPYSPLTTIIIVTLRLRA
ncbi:hypothetical protein HZH66_008707 [Vespula vulgaris]|uniref:Uncharacterized protein n=1 Tax=Vespula vulgaris TaxID=7454 RepID=A0A834JQT9_VESVU|nr:hypothetical protein HZH66_008707 [Vespula vulgaris]